MRAAEGTGMSTYDLDTFTSSTFLWKGCCVGVATDTETVEELCRYMLAIAVHSCACGDAYHAGLQYLIEVP